MSEELVAGVAGAGVFGGHHACKYANSQNLRLGAIFDCDFGRAEALARRFGAKPYSELRPFLDAVDVVTVATPASSHYAIARDALESGCHVLVEKPIALALSHADRLIGIAKDKGLILQVGHQERFVFDAFGIFNRRERPRSIACVRRSPLTGRGEDVSVVFDLMVHDIDLVRRMGFSTPKSLVAYGAADEMDAKFSFASGVEVVFEASRLAPIRERRMTLAYDDGVLEIDFMKKTIVNTTKTPTITTFEDEALAIVDPLAFGVRSFLEAVRGQAAPVISGDDGRDALEWALMIEESASAAAEAGRRQSVRA